MRTKDTVKQALNGYENEMTISRYETIVKATKNVIIHRQIRSRVKQCCNDQQGCKNEELLNCFQEENSNLYGIICDLDETVAFRSKYLLWLSGVVSIGSLTYAQLKAHNVQHEFCTTLTMKVIYSAAALMNTISYILMNTACFTSSLDFNNLLAN